MSLDDMPDFGGEHQHEPEKSPGGKLAPETGLSVKDQQDAIKRLVKFFSIAAVGLLALVLVFKGIVWTYHYIQVSRLESKLEKIIDEKSIDVERTKYTKQFDAWVALVQPDYEKYYPYKSDYEFQKIVGSHKLLMQAATVRLGFVEEQIKGVLKAPRKTEAQIQEALNLWADWKDQTVTEAERQVVEEERQVKQYFAKLKPKEEPKKELPPVEAAPTPPPAPPAPVAVEKPAVVVAPPPAPAAKPAAAPQVQKQEAPAKKQPQESAADRRYLEELQKTLHTK